MNKKTKTKPHFQVLRPVDVGLSRINPPDTSRGTEYHYFREAMPHQDKALAYLNDRTGGALWMEMRLGKTLVAVRHLKQRLAENLMPRILVVGPPEALWAWKRELEMECITPLVLTGPGPDRRDLWQKTKNSAHYSYFLINYEGLKIIPELQTWPWDAIVLDESRIIANPKNVANKFLSKMPRRGEARLCLAGKPAPESPLEYFEQYKFLYGKFMGCSNFWQFRNAMFTELQPHEWVPKPGRLDRLKAAIHEAGFFMTRKQAGIHDVKVKERRVCLFPEKIRKMYNKIRTDFAAELEGKEIAFTKWIPVQYMWLHQLSSGFLGTTCHWPGKLNALEDLLTGELADEQVVVWFKFNPALELVSQRLTALGITHGRILGEEDKDARFQSIDDFRAGKLRVLLCQIKCAKRAIDLSTSSTAIYFSNTHSLDERMQSEDRLVNPKKTDPNLYIDLITEDTVEEDILTMLSMKRGEAAFYESRMLINLLRGTILC